MQGVVTVFDSTDNGTIAVAPSSGSVRGGTLLRIQGSGRFRQSSRYLCVFEVGQVGAGQQQQQQQNATSDASYVSASEVVCVTPAVTSLWLNTSTKNGAVALSGSFFLCVDDVEFYPATFMYYSDSVQVQTVMPSVITSTGGLVQIVLNDSMVQALVGSGQQFSCVVQGLVIPALPLDANITVPPILSETSKKNGTDGVYTLICPVPPYEVSFGPLLLNNSMKSGVELSIGVTINGVDMFYSVTPLTVITTPVIGSLAPPVAMIRSGVDSSALRPSSNPLVTIYGVGFTNTTTLACMVGSGGGDSSDKTMSSTVTPALYINATTVQCNLNYTLPGPQIVQFSVNRVHWLSVGMFEYVAAPVLIAIVPANGPDHGNTVVRIHMASIAIGAGSVSVLSCEFLLQGASLQLVPAWVDNNNDVLCTTIAMPPGVVKVYLNYYGQRSDSYVNFTSYPTGEKATSDNATLYQSMLPSKISSNTAPFILLHPHSCFPESMVALSPTNVQAGKILTIDGKLLSFILHPSPHSPQHVPPCQISLSNPLSHSNFTQIHVGTNFQNTSSLSCQFVNQVGSLPGSIVPAIFISSSRLTCVVPVVKNIFNIGTTTFSHQMMVRVSSNGLDFSPQGLTVTYLPVLEVK